jgi:cytochrome c-type biogenesis protein
LDTPLSTNADLIGKFTSQLQSAPSSDFSLKDLNGKEWKLSDLKGKVVLLNFWATWCGPCQREMPGFQKLYERFGEDGEVLVLTVASVATENMGEKESRDTVKQFITGQKYTFPVLFDADGSVWKAYQQEGIPANYILDKQGNIKLLITGAFPNEETMVAALEAVRRQDGK